MTTTDRRGIDISSSEQAIKMAARVATTAAITLSGLQTIDTIALADGDRVLVKDQVDQRTNGIYDASPGNWTRSVDASSNATVLSGMIVGIVVGLQYGANEFILTTDGDISLGTTNLVFERVRSIASRVVNDSLAYGATVKDALDGLRAIKPTFNRFVFEGDSITVHNDATSWDAVLKTLDARFATTPLYNFASNGDNAVAMVGEYDTQAHTVRPLNNSDKNSYFFIFAGGNDILGDTSGATTYTALKAIWAKARADGYIVVAFMVMNRTTFTGTKATQFAALNALILSDPTLYDYLVRADQILPDPTSVIDFADGTHPTPVGYAKIAVGVRTTIVAVRAGDLNQSPRALFDLLIGSPNTLGDPVGNALITAPSIYLPSDIVGPTLMLQSNAAAAAGVGASVALGGRFSAGSNAVGFAAIQGSKANGTSGNNDGLLSFFVRVDSFGYVTAAQFTKDRTLIMPGYGSGILSSDASGNITSGATPTFSTVTASVLALKDTPATHTLSLFTNETLSANYNLIINPNNGSRQVTVYGNVALDNWFDQSVKSVASPTFAAVVAPAVRGGTGTTSSLTLQPTSGVGAAGADVIFKVGNNGATEAARILNSGNFGVGTNAPQSRLHLNANTTQNVVPSQSPILQISGADSVQTAMELDSYGAQALHSARRANGTAASPTALANSDILLNLFAAGYNGASYIPVSGIVISAEEAYSVGANGTGISFYTTPKLSSSTSVAARINASGGLSVGPASDPGVGAIAANTSITATTFLKAGSFTVAGLPAGSTGAAVWCSNCRVFNGAGVQEGAAAGTGGLVTYNSAAWKIAGTNVTAVA